MTTLFQKKKWKESAISGVHLRNDPHPFERSTVPSVDRFLFIGSCKKKKDSREASFMWVTSKEGVTFHPQNAVHSGLPIGVIHARAGFVHPYAVPV